MKMLQCVVKGLIKKRVGIGEIQFCFMLSGD